MSTAYVETYRFVGSERVVNFNHDSTGRLCLYVQLRLLEKGLFSKSTSQLSYASTFNVLFCSVGGGQLKWFNMPTWFVCLTYWFEGSRVCQFSTLTQHVNFVYTMKYWGNSGVSVLKNLTCTLRSSVEGIVLLGQEGVSSQNESRCPLGSSVQCIVL